MLHAPQTMTLTIEAPMCDSVLMPDPLEAEYVY